MKTLYAVTLAAILVLSAMAAHGASLVCDPQAGVVSYDVDIDGTITQSVPAEPDGSILYGVDYLSQGQHTFKLRAIGTGGWPSDWSSPFDAIKPGNPLNARIVNP